MSRDLAWISKTAADLTSVFISLKPKLTVHAAHRTSGTRWWRLVSVRSANQRAVCGIKALAYWTAGGIFLEAVFAVHVTEWTFAANKRLLLRLRTFFRLRIFI